MTSAAMRTLLRVTAIAIAVAALIDPAFSSTRPADRRLVAIVAASQPNAADRLRDAASGWDVTIRNTTGPSIPCAPVERCVLIADGSIDVDIPGDLREPIALISSKVSGEPNVEVRAAIVSSTHASAAGNARVDLIRS